MTRVLVLSHTTGYQLRAFDEAAESLGIELVFATDRCHHLDDPWQDRAIPVRFFDLDSSVAAIERHHHEFPIRGVIAVGDRPVVLAARVAERLGIEWHSVVGASASTDKSHARTALAFAGLPSPAFSAHFVTWPADSRVPRVIQRFPVVLKPMGLSGSRGVIRADDEEAFAAAYQRICALLARPQIREARTGLDTEILVEAYIDGKEYAIEGVLTHGAFRAFAIFDKPDPLTGPFFEETIYVTPSRAPEAIQARILEQVARAAAVLRLSHGPLHAECRVTEKGEVYVLEVAARPIGGLCSRVLGFSRASDPGTRHSLERVLLEHALGRPTDDYIREADAAAVMMIPIPARGLFKEVTGKEAARAVPGVSGLYITAKPDQLLEPLPEAGSYLGFIFARGATPADAEGAIREAHARLSFDIAKSVPVVANG
jgi:biotin carboxylase